MSRSRSGAAAPDEALSETAPADAAQPDSGRPAEAGDLARDPFAPATGQGAAPHLIQPGNPALDVFAPVTRQAAAPHQDPDLDDVLIRAGYLASASVPVFVGSGRGARRAGRFWRSGRRVDSPRGLIKAITLLTAITLASTALMWATVVLADSAFSEGKGTYPAGPLVFPAPGQADSLPLRGGPIPDRAEKRVLAAFKQRFAGALAGHGVGALRPAGIYGEPGQIDPATGRTAWIMYLGLGSTRPMGAPAFTLTSVMMDLLSPSSVTGSWRVPAGARGGSAQCTVTTLAGTQVSVCGWATQRTVGIVVSPVRASSWARLAALMIKMRYDLEQPGAPRPS